MVSRQVPSGFLGSNSILAEREGAIDSRIRVCLLQLLQIASSLGVEFIPKQRKTRKGKCLLLGTKRTRVGQ